MAGSVKVILVLLLIGYTHGQEQGSDEVDCVSREEFGRVTAEIDRVDARLQGIKDELDMGQKGIVDILSQLQTDVRDIHSTINNNSLLHDERQQKLLQGVAQNTSLIQLEDKVEEIRDNIHVGALQHTELEEQLGEITRELSQIKANQYTPVSGTFQNPAPSCNGLSAGSRSSYYYIQSSSAGNGAIRVYCDMTRRCCNSTGGWMRVAELDMTDPTQNCPSGFRLRTSPKRSCVRPGPGCVSTTFPVHGVQYSRVCGRVIAYQKSTPDAFAPYYHNRQVTIDDVYVDGVSLTHGNNTRKHIWTFAAAVDETQHGAGVCPCTNVVYTGAVPPFIGQDYFCDTGSRNHYQHIFYPDDPLWDGAGCGPTSTCCSFNNPPWFCKQLPQPTTDDIELRLCGDESLSNEDIGMEIVELYVR